MPGFDSRNATVYFCPAYMSQNAARASFLGFVEHVSNVRVKGWVRGPTSEPVRLRVLVDGRQVATVSASGLRPDVGPHAFDHVFQPALVFRADMSIRVVVEGDTEHEVPRLGGKAVACELPPRSPIRRLRVPLYDSPFLSEIAKSDGWTSERLTFLEQFAETGLARIQLDRAFFEPIRERIVEGLAGRYGGQPRLMDAWRYDDGVRELACSHQVMETLELLFGRPAIPMQTLNFAVGTEQSTHSDTVHFNSMPAGFMCGAWVALEPITLRNGPLHYYPGSHRMPILDLDAVGVVASSDVWSQNYEYHQQVLQELIRVKGFEKTILQADPGDVIIWAANLLHGGEPILDRTSSRHSQVTHYYFEGCSYYTPMRSNVPMGQFHRPDRRDIRTGERLKHRFDDIELPYVHCLD